MVARPPLVVEHHECPACGGAGGGPFGRLGSAWDTEEYVCPRCKGLGYVVAEVAAANRPTVERPGIAKTVPTHAARDAKKKRRSSGA